MFGAAAWVVDETGKERGEGIVTLYATPNPFLLNEICLNQQERETNKQFLSVVSPMGKVKVKAKISR